MEITSRISDAVLTAERPTVSTKLTDVNIDCLEEIFKYLKLNDLLNVSDTCKRLRKASSFIFKNSYQPKIYINHSYLYSGWRMKYYHSWNNTVDSKIMEKLEKPQKLYTLKACFQLLRCFGTCITFIEITNINRFENFRMITTSYIYNTTYERLVSYVNEYCYETLTEINTIGCPQAAFDKMKNPFLKVEKLKTQACVLKTTLWNTLFPQLRHLFYIDYYEFNCKNCITENSPSHCIENKFSHLENLTVDEKFTNICNVMRLNSQLTTLKLLYVPDINILQNISSSLPILENLTFTVDYDVIPILQHNRIHFRSVKKFTIQNQERYIEERNTMDSYKFPSIEFDCPFTFDHLKVLTCTWSQSFESADDIYKFLKENSSIVELRLSRYDIMLVDPLEIANILDSLEFIEIFGCFENVEMLINLCNIIKTLKMVTVIIQWHDLEYLTSRVTLKDITIIKAEGYPNSVQVKLLLA